MLLDKLNELSEIRLKTAKECLSVAKNNFSNNYYKAAANRAYYAVFHAMRAVLALDEYDSKKHSGIISEFRKRYIKTKIFDAGFSVTITELFNSRTDCDYDDFFEISADAVKNQIEAAEEFICVVEKYLNTKKGLLP